MHYEVAGRGPYLVSEEGDRLATATAPAQVAAIVDERCHARLADHLALGSWTAAGAGIARVARRRALIVGDGGTGPIALLQRLGDDGGDVEGDDTAFFRDGSAVALPAPRATHVELGPIDVVFVLDDQEQAPCVPVGTLELVQAVVGRALPWPAEPGQVVRAASELVGRADGYRLGAGSVHERGQSIVTACSRTSA
jgi:hypothetical protein